MKSAWRIALVLSMTAIPTLGSAQESRCTITQDEYGRMSRALEHGHELILIHDPFFVTCDDGAELRANSGRLNQTTRELYLLGNVFFQDTLQTLTSNEATYDANTGRLWARGDVVYVNRKEGSTLTGPELEYLRVTEDRPVARMNAIQRPTLSIAPAEGSANPQALEVIADRIEIVGQEEMSAYGAVDIRRDDLIAKAGQAFYDSATEELQLRVGAFVESGEFELEGDAIDVRLAEGAIQYLNARTGAALRGEDLEVTGGNLMLFFENDLLQSVVAVAPPGEGERATATSRTFRLQADSLHAMLTDQRLDEVHAIGSAFGETIDTLAAGPTIVAQAGDSVLAEVADSADAMPDVLASDWIRGDTIIGYFVAADNNDGAANGTEPSETLEAEAGDSPDAVGEPQLGLGAPVDPDSAQSMPDARQSVELSRLVARGGAQSLYRLAGPDDADGGARRNANFLVGREIELTMTGGELEVARVEGLQYGVYVERVPSQEEPGPTLEEVDPDAVEEDPAVEPAGGV